MVTSSERLLPPRIEGVQSPRSVSFDVLRLCASERDAMLVSLRVGKVSQAAAAARMGVSQQAVSKWLSEGIPSGRVTAFCNATVCSALAQYHAMHRAFRESSGVARESDRIAQIAALAVAA